MSQHSAAGAPLRRAHAAAGFTFVFMAGTTMTFQTYHAVETGEMPWPLAVLFGIGAFILAISVLEFARHSPSSLVRAGAYVLTAGAMYLSASATGDVTRHAAPPHAQLLFGLLMDGAALLAIHFILNGPRSADAVAAVAQREAQLIAEAHAERAAREEAARAHEAEIAAARQAHDTAMTALQERLDGESAAREIAEADAALRAAAEADRARLAADLDAARQARDADLRVLRRQLADERAARETAEQDAVGRSEAETERDVARTDAQTARAALEAAETARSEAEQAAAKAAAKADWLTRKAASAAGARNPQKDAGGSRRTAAKADPYKILDAQPDTNGAELARLCGMSERWGQDRRKEWLERAAGADGTGTDGS